MMTSPSKCALRVLAVDFGSKCGWASIGPDTGLQGGVARLHQSGAHPGRRYDVFEKFILGQHGRLGRFDALVYERVFRHMSADSAHVHGGYLATLQMMGYLYDCPVVGYPWQSIKHHACGKGPKASKSDVVKAAQSMDWNPIDDNHADALWMLDLYLVAEAGIKRPGIINYR